MVPHCYFHRDAQGSTRPTASRQNPQPHWLQRLLSWPSDLVTGIPNQVSSLQVVGRLLVAELWDGCQIRHSFHSSGPEAGRDHMESAASASVRHPKCANYSFCLYNYSMFMTEKLKLQINRKKSTIWKKRALMVWFIVMFSLVHIGTRMFYKSFLEMLSTGDLCIKFGVLWSG